MSDPTGVKEVNEIFLVHGRDNDANEGMRAFLESLGLRVVEWSEAKKDAKGQSPYVIEIVKKAIKNKAVLVLLTPDEVTFLRNWFVTDKEDSEPAAQSRPNVLFEAGLALGANPHHTVIVVMGSARIPSDLLGLHIEKFDGSPEKRQALADELKKAGCNINRNGTRWLNKAGSHYFEKALKRQKESDIKVDRGIPAGVRISNSPYKFDSVIDDKCNEIFMTGHNFADQLDPQKGAILLRVVKNSLEVNKELRMTLVFAPPDLLKEAHEEGYRDLINTSIPQFVNLKYGSLLNEEQQQRLFIYCSSGALSLSCFARDINDDNGLITVNPRWITDQMGGGRMYFAVRKSDNAEIYESMRKQIDLAYSEIREIHPTAKTLRQVVLELDKKGVKLDIVPNILHKLRSK